MAVRKDWNKSSESKMAALLQKITNVKVVVTTYYDSLFTCEWIQMYHLGVFATTHVYIRAPRIVLKNLLTEYGSTVEWTWVKYDMFFSDELTDTLIQPLTRSFMQFYFHLPFCMLIYFSFFY